MKKLLFSITSKDLEIQYFSGTGAGGQYRNKHQNCVRIQHKESGTLVTGQSNRERQANTKEAFNNLINHPKFKIWYNAKVFEKLSGKTMEQRIEESMSEENLIIEGLDENGKWVQV